MSTKTLALEAEYMVGHHILTPETQARRASFEHEKHGVHVQLGDDRIRLCGSVEQAGHEEYTRAIERGLVKFDETLEALVHWTRWDDIPDDPFYLAVETLDHATVLAGAESAPLQEVALLAAA